MDNKVKPKRLVLKIPVLILKAFLFILLFLVLSEMFFRVYYKNKISPNIYLFSENMSGYDKDKFLKLLEQSNSGFDKITVSDGISENYIYLTDINYHINYENNWNKALSLKKTYLNNFYNLSVISLFKRVGFTEDVSFDKNLLASEIENVASIYTTRAVFESVVLEDGGVKVTAGKDGIHVNDEVFKDDIYKALQNKILEVPVPIEKVNASIPIEQKGNLLSQAEKLIGRKIVINLGDKTYEIEDWELVSTLNDRPENKFENIESISKKIEEKFNNEPKNSVIVFENNRVSEFVASEDGIRVDTNILKDELIRKRNELAYTDLKFLEIPLPHEKTSPKITTGDINNIGIKEKIGSGHSTFKGSIASRIHNIKLASSKFNGVLIAPGETLSFNKTLGDVSKVTGYQQAYIIKDGQTILGDGGGVCQVSTTFFRAALDSGLPIIERRSHSYRVGYYEQGFPPGLDATVFDPSTDLKIKNDFENHILIQTVFDENTKSLTFDLYGTKDGRIVNMSKPVTKDVSSPPEDLYIDDPTLKAGIIKQIEYKSWGAKVYFNYKVEKDGVITFEKTFYSNYQPWQAKYLRGTAL